MTCTIVSLASTASFSTCASETGEGEATPRSSTSGERSSAVDTSPTKISWADELDAEVPQESRAVRTAASAPRARSSAFRAVWCFERCFKDEEEPVRSAITEAVTSLGGSLFCYKKAKTFEARAAHMRPQSYALITDGREARPCVQALATLPQNQPALIVILSENPKHADRVARWAKELPSEGFHVPVFVVRSAAEIRPILADSPLPRLRTAGVANSPVAPHFPFDLKALTAQFGSPGTATPTSMTSTTPSVAVQRQFMGCGDATRTHCAAWPVVSTDATRAVTVSWPVPAHPTMPVSSPMSPWPTTSESPFLLEKSAEGVEPNVLGVLSVAVPSCVGPAILEQMLTQSAPEVYEE
mmetsp:Transcript_19365/g.55532  ORF Transcript_19365/g.55532 Transcript_19365/m.55532 type:complete len:356 (-) Transcript_19365:556-1623(-)